MADEIIKQSNAKRSRMEWSIIRLFVYMLIFQTAWMSKSSRFILFKSLSLDHIFVWLQFARNILTNDNIIIWSTNLIHGSPKYVYYLLLGTNANISYLLVLCFKQTKKPIIFITQSASGIYYVVRLKLQLFLTSC